MICIVILAIGFVIGLAVGRWWALALAVAFAAWIWRTIGVEIPHWLLGMFFGGFAAIGIAAGVALRRRLRRGATD